MVLVASVIVACAASSRPSSVASYPPPGSIAAKNYDRTCLSVADCVPVYEGPVGCCGGECPNTAIAQVALARYTMDVGLAAACGGVQPPCGPLPGGNECPDGRVTCDNGVCILAMPPSDAATDE
jgi:hypothetical protein